MLHRMVEMQYVNMDRTWDTDYVWIPANTPEKNVPEVARRVALKNLEESGDQHEVQDILHYHTPPMEDLIESNVVVLDPDTASDRWAHSFIGTIVDLKEDTDGTPLVIVEDQAGNVFDVPYTKIKGEE